MKYKCNNDIKMNIPKDVDFIIKKLEENIAFQVTGYVDGKSKGILRCSRGYVREITFEA